MREKMIVVLLFAVVNSADWTLECNSDSIKITFDQNYLERQTGSRNHKLSKFDLFLISFMFLKFF